MCLSLLFCCVYPKSLKKKKEGKHAVLPTTAIQTLGNVTHGGDGVFTLGGIDETRIGESDSRVQSLPGTSQKPRLSSGGRKLFFSLMLKRRRHERIVPEAMKEYREVAGVLVLCQELRKQVPRTPPVPRPAPKRINTD